MTTKPAPKYQVILRCLRLAAAAYARGTTPDEVERNAHPVLWRLGRAASKQNGGRE
jgi:hypothetical protein